MKKANECPAWSEEYILCHSQIKDIYYEYVIDDHIYYYPHPPKEEK